MDLTEAKDIKKRWQEYTEELYKKDLHDPDNHDGIGGRRRRGRQRMRWLGGITDSMDVSLVMDREAWRAVVHGVTRTQLSD